MNRNKLLVICIILFLIAGFFYLANKNTTFKKSDAVHVTTSFYPMYFFAKEIGGEKAEVYNITPASAEPHDYEPTTQDIARIESSNLLILNGGSIESWGNKIKDDLQGEHTTVVTAGEGLVSKSIKEGGNTTQDPHIWLDPVLAKKEAMAIEKAYEKISPKDTAYFRKNAQRLYAKLDQLDNKYKEGLRTCQLHDFVTSHAAFSYLATQYGITQLAISGISPDEEPSSQKLAEIANFVKKEHIPVIFFESLVSPKLSDTIAHETGAKSLVLDPLEGIPQSQMDQGASYFSVMSQNLVSLKEALQCQ